MKKKYLFLIIVLSIFLFPHSIFAKSVQIEPSRSLFLRSTGDATTLFNFNYSTLNGRYFYYISAGFTTPVDRIIWYYEDGQFSSFKKDNTYDITFAVYMSNIAVATSQGIDSAHPLVNLDGMNCDVDSLYTGSNSSYTYSQMFNVTCRNVEITDSPEVTVFTPSTSASTSSLVLGGNVEYGISSGFGVVVHNSSNDDLKGAIDNQTNEIKKGTEATKENTQATEKQTETIKDSDTSEATNNANSFFDDFESDDYGLSDIVTMPLSFIQGLSNSQCYDLEFPLPFVNKNAKLSCMTSIYQNYFGSFLSLYQIITDGIIAYWVIVNMFRLVQNFKNPDNDEIEVLDL